MAYDYAQYQADRKLLLFRSPKALPVPDVLEMKLALALSRADAANHAAIEAAYARLLAMLAEGPDAIPLPPDERDEVDARAEGEAGQGGPRTTQDRASGPPRQGARLSVVASSDPGQAYAAGEAEVLWASALAAQAERHARRRSHWPAVAPERA